MNGVKTNKICPLLRQIADQRLQIAKITDTPVALRAQCIKLDRAPPLFALAKICRLITMAGADNQLLVN